MSLDLHELSYHVFGKQLRAAIWVATGANANAEDNNNADANQANSPTILFEC